MDFGLLGWQASLVQVEVAAEELALQLNERERSASMASLDRRSRANTMLEGLAHLGDDDIDIMYGELAKEMPHASCREGRGDRDGG